MDGGRRRRRCRPSWKPERSSKQNIRPWLAGATATESATDRACKAREKVNECQTGSPFTAVSSLQILSHTRSSLVRYVNNINTTTMEISYGMLQGWKNLGFLEKVFRFLGF